MEDQELRKEVLDMLKSGIKWNLPDGVCWCPQKREKNWDTKIHTSFCRKAKVVYNKLITEQK